MTLVSLPNTLVAGTPEDIVDVDQNIKAIRDVVNGLLGTDNFAAGSVNGDRLVNASVALAKLAANSVDASKIVDSTVGPAELAIADAVEVSYLGADIPLTTGVGVAIPFDTARKESGVAGMWSAGAPASLYAARAGWHLVGGNCSLAVSLGDVFAARMLISVYNPDTTQKSTVGYQSLNLRDATILEVAGASGFQASMSRLVYLEAGEFCQVIVSANFALGTCTLLGSDAGATRYAAEGQLMYLGKAA